MKKLLSALAAAMMALPSASLAAVLNDEVTSAKIREADGTGSQDTNSGSGVKTNHLQNRAVTNAKLADGAVTDAKISGVLSASKLPVGTAAGTVAAGNHTHAPSRYAGVVTVARSGGDYTDPVAAVAAAGALATATGRYLVKVMPGEYDLQGATLALPVHVDLEGSGAENTVIRTAVASDEVVRCAVATVRMAEGSTVRAIRLVNSGTTGNVSVAIIALGFPGVSGKAEHVILQAGDATAEGDRQTVCVDGAAAHAVLNEALVEGIGGSSHAVMVQAAASVTVTNSRLICTSVNWAIDVINTNHGVTEGDPGAILVMNSVLEGSGPGGVHGIYADEWATTVLNSVFVLNSGPERASRAFQTTGTFRMANSQIIADGLVGYGVSDLADVRIAGSLLPGGAAALPTARLVHNYDESYAPIADQ